MHALANWRVLLKGNWFSGIGLPAVDAKYQTSSDRKLVTEKPGYT
jgi:hypothetical protein